MAQINNPNVFRAALVIIGNEILSGRTQDTNAMWIAEKLLAMGIMLAEIRVVADIEADIVKAVNALRAQNKYVFTTGGIGPTHDDITAASIAKAFGVELETNDEAFRLLEKHYGIEELTPPRIKMAQIPKGATLIPNPVSAAPGFFLENVYVMAGVPRIMQAMLDNVMGSLTPGKPMLSNTIACMLAESTVAEQLSVLQEKYPDVDMGSYPHFRSGAMGLSLVLRATDEVLLKSATEELVVIIRGLGDEPRALGLQALIDNF